MPVIDRPSPNHDARPGGAVVDILVLHYTGMRTAEEALARLCDPQARVSSHYTIDCDGSVYRHVPEERRAWHAGISFWAGERNVNARSIGIELVNPGHEFGYIPYSDAQIASLIEVALGVLARHPIPPDRVVGHSDVAPHRKTDPGELFPWELLADRGIGLFPMRVSLTAGNARDLARNHSKMPDAPDQAMISEPARMIGGRAPSGAGKPVSQLLAQFGYGVPPDVDWPLDSVIAAFQRHFRPSRIDGIADAETTARIESLLAGRDRHGR